MQKTENIETFKNALREKASKNSDSRRRRNSDSDIYGLENIIDPYELDYCALLESKALRRLSSKTQVFTAPANLHVRNRRTHTDEVIALSTKIATVLGLNINLCKSIALGHDIGHPPFGHQGEEIISEKCGNIFRHEIFSVVIAQKIERKGCGLNLNHQTLNGILNHSKGAANIIADDKLPLEYNVVMYSDKISYVFSDVQDIQRFNFKYNQNEFDLILKDFGFNQRKRVFNCMLDLIRASAEKGLISFSDTKLSKKFAYLKNWMYENIYKNLNNRKILKTIMEQLYDRLADIQDKIGIEPAIFIALMTDNDVMDITPKIFSLPYLQITDFEKYGAMEIAKYLKNKSVNFMDPDLSW